MLKSASIQGIIYLLEASDVWYIGEQFPCLENEDFITKSGSSDISDTDGRLID